MADEDRVTKIIDTFFEQVTSNDIEEAIDNVFAMSALATQNREKATIAVHISNLIAINGPITRRELVAESSLGTMCVKQNHIVQLDRAVTRWEFVLILIPSGWATVHLGFNEAAQDWF